MSQRQIIRREERKLEERIIDEDLKKKKDESNKESYLEVKWKEETTRIRKIEKQNEKKHMQQERNNEWLRKRKT